MTLVTETRGSILECSHDGCIAVCDEGGLKYFAGDPNFFAFYRSASKPMQVLPVHVLGIPEKYGLTDEEASLMNGSLYCGPHQIELVKSVMEKAAISYDTFIMHPCYPISDEYLKLYVSQGLPPSKLYHNCIGKHLGLILMQRELGGLEQDYYKIESPTQQLILEYISALAEYPKERIGIGADGCGVPVFALPLHNMAASFLKLAATDLIENSDIRAAAERNRIIVSKHPENLMDAKALCGELCKDPNIIGKAGAEGIYTLALHDERLGIAMKMYSGIGCFFPIIVAALLEKLNYKNKDTITRLREKFPPIVKNATDSIVGEQKAVFELTRI